MVSASRRGLVSELAAHDRLLEVGIGRRPEVARALAERGCEVVGIDVEVETRAREAARAVRRAAAEGRIEGTLRVDRGDVLSLVGDGAAGHDGDGAVLGGEETGFDAVYACNLPAELQRPTVALADRLDAACSFTTLGFEEPVVPVRRRSVSGTTLYIARDDGNGGDDGPNARG